MKLPEADLQPSVSWYLSLLDLELGAEFVQQGILRGAVLIDRDTGCVIALRDREVCANRPKLTGFDVFALEAESVSALHQLANRCEHLGVRHGSVQDRGDWGASLDIPDPDGTVLRFLANNPFIPGRFLGVDFDADADREPRFYSGPRLHTPGDNPLGGARSPT